MIKEQFTSSPFNFEQNVMGRMEKVLRDGTNKKNKISQQWKATSSRVPSDGQSTWAIWEDEK